MIALLNGGEQFVMADLFTFTLVGGSILRYSSGPTALNANGFLFQLGPKFERSKTKLVTGIQVDQLTIKVYPETGDQIGASPFLQALWTGQLDGALLQLERAFMPTYGDASAGTVVLFAGRISNIDCSRTGATIDVRSHLELLNIQMPRRLWQSSCTHIFGGPMCQFNRASLLANFTATAGSTPTKINGPPAVSVPFALGTLTGASGANNGYSRTIASWISGVSVTVNLAFLFPVAVGDAFQMLPGCDKTQSTCQNKFNNVIHFGGFPYIPTPETAV